MDVEVREIREDEYERVGELLLAAYDGVGAFSEDYRTFLRRPDQWVADTTVTLVAVMDDEPVGVVSFVTPGDREFEHMQPPTSDCGFRFLAVAPKAQGSGAGAALVDRVIDMAKERGCRRMVIHSMYFMTAAHGLYARRGFVRRPDLDVVFPTGLGICFALDLSPDAADHFPAPGPVPDEPPWFEELWLNPDDPAAEVTTTPC